MTAYWPPSSRSSQNPVCYDQKVGFWLLLGNLLVHKIVNGNYKRPNEVLSVHRLYKTGKWDKVANPGLFAVNYMAD